MPTWIKKVSKAIGAAIAGGITAATAWEAANPSDSLWTAGGVTAVVSAVVGAFVVTYFFPANATSNSSPT